MDDTDKVQLLVDDAAQNGLEILRSDHSTAAIYRFVPIDDKRIRYGLGAVKGTGEAAIGHIIAVRAGRRAVQGLVRFLPPRRQTHSSIAACGNR